MDVLLISEALEISSLNCKVKVVQDGEKAVRYFEEVDRDESARCVDLVILDINLPKRHGKDVLRALRASEKCGKSRVLVVTSSDSQQDRQEMARLGANAYFRKPSEYDAYMKLGEIARELLGTGT